MTSAYPGATDSFNVPTEPEGTPLSSAGSASRNHTENHAVLGSAITALETNAALKGHDHSGDAADIHKGAKLAQANTHQSADTDASLTAIHHTLGSLPFQAATGDHVHDYSGGTIVNKAVEVCLSTQRPTQTFLGKQIYEYDTNRHRVWSAFAGNVVNHNVLGTDLFERTSTTDPGSDWIVDYTGSQGRMATPGGHTLKWIDNSGLATLTNRSLARNVNATYQHTTTKDQVIVFQTGNQLMEQSIFTDICYNDIYFRMSDDRNSYIRVGVAFGWVDVWYSTDSSTKISHEIKFGTGRMWGTAGGRQITWTMMMVGRTITLYRDGAFFGALTDNGSALAPLDANRGWGTGMVASGALITQVTPADLNYITIADAAQFGTIQRWTLLSDASVPHCLLVQTVPQTLSASGTILVWGAASEDNFTSWSPTDPTKVTIQEPGMYHFDIGMQWDAQMVSDVGSVVLCVNGLETAIRNAGPLRGNGITPGFSQSLTVSGKYRLAATDVVTVKVKYTAGGGIIGAILSWFDGPSRTQCRFDMSYIGL